MTESASSAPALPPPAPAPVTDRETGRGIRNSAIAHAALIIGFLIYTRVAPPTAIPFVPTLRVDLVGLPDTLKKDLALPTEQTPPPPAPAPKEEPKERAKPDEMALKPKKDPALDRASAMKNALKRMKALAKISEENAQPIRGNKISHGSSLDGNAKEGEASYYDRLRARLQDNWALPVWLSRQNLSAKVQVQIDAVGRLASFQFVQRSGNAQFDEAVSQTLKDSVPFPRPPGAVSVLVGFPL